MLSKSGRARLQLFYFGFIIIRVIAVIYLCCLCKLWRFEPHLAEHDEQAVSVSYDRLNAVQRKTNLFT